MRGYNIAEQRSELEVPGDAPLHNSGKRFRDAMPEVMFAGPDGRLEGRYHHSKETGAPVALILHPHPLHGGTMNNRVTYSMYQSFQRLGCSVMRFNFRGSVAARAAMTAALARSVTPRRRSTGCRR